MSDFYQILGVKKNATDAEIHSAFRRLAKATHPDLNQNNPAKIAQFTQIKQAYDTLSNADKRKKYDAQITQKSTPTRNTPQRSTQNNRRTANSPFGRHPSYSYRNNPIRPRSYIRLLFRYHLFSSFIIIGLYIILRQLTRFRFKYILIGILIYKALWLITLFTLFHYRRHHPRTK